MKAAVLALACFAILAGTLAAGLWPFHAPLNQALWLPNGEGLWFGGYGTALSASAFKAPSIPSDESCSIAVWLVPALTWNRRTILAFYAPNRTAPFSLHQSNRDLVIESQKTSALPGKGAIKLAVDGIFREGAPVFIAITSDGHQTAAYVDGVLIKESRELVFSSSDLAGELVVANSPVVDNSWAGQFKGLAIDHRFLSQPAALQEYQAWTLRGRPSVTGESRAVALYRFDQASGRFVRNQAGHQPDLYIPQRFMLAHQVFLERPWDEYRRDRSYGKDVLINIAGFIPLGFIFCAWFSWVRRSRRAGLMTIALGAAVSITIEVLQSFLPTRFSGMTDIFTNTLGAAGGVALFGYAERVCETLTRSRHDPVRAIATWVINGA